MKNLPLIAEQIREAFDIRTQVRDQALVRSRALTRHCANSIRAIHRSEEDAANEQLAQAAELVVLLKQELQPYPSLYYAGYTQDAIKEFVEANCTIALILNQPLPQPDELDVEYATYLNGLAEVMPAWMTFTMCWSPWITRMQSLTGCAARQMWCAASWNAPGQT